MNKPQLEIIRIQLLSLKSKINALEDELKAATGTVVLDQTRVGRLSRMDAMQAQQMALESARRRQHQLVKIDGALQRIESGEFGYCYICGEEINNTRLSADPTSTRCMECVEK
ncbi:MAG: TraR/DksA family transcriptional regulator [Gammaproteobacteria bacterium]|nr:MAG: TraR/DksA family transcriptional regulator [Gammaproteobacteria bacterium]